MTRLRVATQNQHKLREFREMLAPLGFEVVGVDDLDGFNVIEDGDTFEANAEKKVLAVVERTGELALADDSGLVVDALGGAPGVHSARYAGATGAGQDAANRKKLIEALRDVPAPKRSARFVCALAYATPGAKTIFFRGTLEGTIGHDERGHGGFGYDPIFVLPERSKTLAELSSDDKHAISHRGAALRALLSHIKGK